MFLVYKRTNINRPEYFIYKPNANNVYGNLISNKLVRGNCNDVPLLYVLVDEDFKVETKANELLVKVMELREGERFRDDFEADDIVVHGNLQFA